MADKAGSAAGPAGPAATKDTKPAEKKVEKKEAFTISATVKPAVKFNPLAWALWGLDLGIWTATLYGPAKWMHNLYTRNNVRSREVVRADRVGLAVGADNEPIHLIVGEEHIKTAHDLWQRNFTKFGDRRCIGTRKYLGEYKPEGARFPLSMFGETEWLSYNETGARARAFGAGLRHLGMQPQPRGVPFDVLDGPHTLLVWEDTSREFLTALIGAGGQSIAVATSYATLGIGAVAEAVNQGNVRVIVANWRQLDNLLKLKAQCPTLETIIVSHHRATDEQLAKPLPSAAGVRLISFEDVLALGEDKPVDFAPPHEETISVVMYTSGSTGATKGVVIRHESFVASVGGMYEWVKANTNLKEGEETYVAYLPAAHILELVAEHALASYGCEIGFACPRTITSRGAVRKRPDGTINTKPEWPYPPGGLQEFRPSILAGVPKVWDIFKKAVEAVVAQSPAKRFIIDVAFPARAKALEQGRETPLFKKLFEKIAAIVGGRLKIGLVGGGPCSSEVQTFVRTAFAIPFIQGYALTETCCAGCIQWVNDSRNGVVGPPLPCVRIRLQDCGGDDPVLDKAGRPYLTTDTEHQGEPCTGRGEVWISGVSVSQGYYKQPELTAQAFVEYDGRRWFKTGDIGVYTPDGSLRIVDRAKNLVKLHGGEYIAIEHMECTYGAAAQVDAVNGGIMCYGDGEIDRPIAFVQIAPKEIEEYAASQGITGSLEKLCEDKRVCEWVTEQLNAVGKRSGLSALELLGGVMLFSGQGARGPGGSLGRHEAWTPDNGGLTATNKISRKPLQATFAKELDVLRKEYGIRA